MTAESQGRNNDLGSLSILGGPLDPKVTPVFAQRGMYYLQIPTVTGDIGLFRKLDNGSTTNWEKIPDDIIVAITDVKVKVSSNDTTSDFLLSKLVAGTNVTLTEQNDGGNENIKIDCLILA